MKTARDYPVTFAYGAKDMYFYGPKGIIGKYHRGDDREMPVGTPVVLNGRTKIGLSGTSGASSGNHLHTGRFLLGKDINPNGGGFKFKSGKVFATGEDSVNGKWVKVRSNVSGAVWVYLHLSKITCKAGDKV